MIKYIWKIMFIALLGFIACAPKEQAPGEKPDIPKDFTLTSIDGEDFTLSKLENHVVILDFWATWCPPCTTSIPVFINLYNEYKDRGFIVLGLSIEDKTTLKEFRDQIQIPYPILLGTKKVAQTYNVQYIPTMVIINKKGKVSKTHIGFSPKLESMLSSYIDSLLNE